MVETVAPTQVVPTHIAFNNHKTWLLPHKRAKPSSIDEVSIEHFLEYLDGAERIEFFNELSDAVVAGGIVHVIVPYYSHVQSLANWAIKWPPMSEHSFLFLSKQWRTDRPYTDHLGYTSDFDLTQYEYEMTDTWQTRHDNARTFGVEHYLGCVVRLFATLVKVDTQEDRKVV